ncbi:hypothetical protein EN837_08435 [bacterium M00.F.Ca.ET.194.01.1.1]|nr:hypothetical protein EN837_08435 [bacterium M00.F.Ca.ET.194.01.1.1]TGS56287.1 hypothetical protein EN822_08435 [bacterium M00.F.Ca.ET.179.01.1.1]TGV49192.1 hypothetical protein EN811_08435 [bacterium M00.F.Ca.ET.168.01.1.1]
MTAPYTAGTISLVSGSPTVAGTDTAWEVSLIIGGTIYVEFDGGNPLPIATVDSDTEITAALNWTGPTGTYTYAIVRDTAYGQQTVTNAQALATYIQRLNNPALAATAGVTPGSNKLLLFTGANSATVIDLEDLLQGVKFDEEVPTLADRAIYDGEAEGFRVLVANIGDGRSAFYTKKSAASGDWSVPFYITGPVGGAGPYTDITIGPTETLPAGADAEVTLVPVSPGVIRLDFGLPKGADGTGTGDVVGPAGAINNAIATFADTTGKLIKASTPAEAGIPIAGYISPGANLANNVADATNDLDFPACVVASSAASPIMMTHPAGTAQLDVAYGSGNGGRFDTAISDGTWHCFIISNGTTVSRGLSKSLDPTTQPNYPAGFMHYRRVASWIRVGGSLAQIKQRGDEFMYVSPVGDKTGVTALTNVLLSLSVPTGISVLALLRISFVVGSGGFMLAQGGDGDYATVNNVLGRSDAGGNALPFIRGLFTNVSGQIRYSLSVSGTVTENNVLTVGWVDTRGRA